MTLRFNILETTIKIFVAQKQKQTQKQKTRLREQANLLLRNNRCQKGNTISEKTEMIKKNYSKRKEKTCIEKKREKQEWK